LRSFLVAALVVAVIFVVFLIAFLVWFVVKGRHQMRRIKDTRLSDEPTFAAPRAAPKPAAPSPDPANERVSKEESSSSEVYSPPAKKVAATTSSGSVGDSLTGSIGGDQPKRAGSSNTVIDKLLSKRGGDVQKF
jgi:cytoskeletal protein RodZ